MWQEAIVCCIVAAAALHAAGKYLPAAARRRIVHLLTRCGADQARMAALLKTADSCGDGCASCGSCGDGAAPAPPLEAPGKHRVIKLRAQSGR
ncbi:MULTISPECIES: DUF6587 family protein [unclassified Janthinobacterium]|uniref:DUF6587 family protein n=1 Tax=unclassified Janthinobacterium TaxID=2610881 RepID=UPI00034A4AE7|nr:MULTISPECIES: DUF6587 family protein [unclassified Janthinobacterium]MEC5162441.1 hypothetical protein [Janthinobacterium sp. CG_S6]